MVMEQLLDALGSSERNDALRLLEGIVVDVDPRLVQKLSDVISQPESIEDTHSFVSLLAEIKAEEFIKPLTEAVSIGDPEKTDWLADYMYALGSLLRETDDYWQPKEEFVHLLGKWMLTTGGGEISWKAGTILSELDHPATHQYYIKGAADRSLLHLTRIACIRGIVTFIKEPGPIEQLLNDPDPYVKEDAGDALAWLEKHRPQQP